MKKIDFFAQGFHLCSDVEKGGVGVSVEMSFSVGLAGDDAVDEFTKDESLDGGRSGREFWGLDETEDAVRFVEGDGVCGT